MRRYAKIIPQFWIGETGRKLREAGSDALLVALYLLSNPHANMLGLYYLPTSLIAHETGLTPQGASEGLRRAIEAGFCLYDGSSEMVFVLEMARYQVADQLVSTDKQCAGIQREYDALPNNPFFAAFYEKYAKAFHLTFSRDNSRPSEGSSKAHRSQEQEQEQEIEKNLLSRSEPKAGSDRERTFAKTDEFGQAVQDIWKYYCLKLGRSKLAKLTEKRMALATARLKECHADAREPKLESAVAVMKLCIDRLSSNPWHNGANPAGKKYLDWEILFRSREQFEKWLNDENFCEPTRFEIPGNGTHPVMTTPRVGIPA